MKVGSPEFQSATAKLKLVQEAFDELASTRELLMVRTMEYDTVIARHRETGETARFRGETPEGWDRVEDGGKVLVPVIGSNSDDPHRLLALLEMARTNLTLWLNGISFDTDERGRMQIGSRGMPHVVEPENLKSLQAIEQKALEAAEES